MKTDVQDRYIHTAKAREQDLSKEHVGGAVGSIALCVALLIASMIRSANCWDNAVTEALFGSLNVERLRREKFITVRAAKDVTLPSQNVKSKK